MGTARAPVLTLQLTEKQASALASWIAYLDAGPTDWEEGGGDRAGINQVSQKLAAARLKAIPAKPAVPAAPAPAPLADPKCGDCLMDFAEVVPVKDCKRHTRAS